MTCAESFLSKNAVSKKSTILHEHIALDQYLLLLKDRHNRSKYGLAVTYTSRGSGESSSAQPLTFFLREFPLP